MPSSVLSTFPIAQQWPTLDPFLFTAHHLDFYPAGGDRLAPEPAMLTGRQLGSDFSGQDGWSMYHGRSVPGFPQHPHRGFETITYVRQGFCDHTDSLGAAARFGRGDTQWLTAGSGIVHAEMFPLVEPHAANTLELFQIWLNLPAGDKMVPAYFTMLWNEDTPRVGHVDRHGRSSELTVVAGSYGDHATRTPPNSWATQPEAAIGVWHIALEALAEFPLPPAPDDGVNRALYVFDGSWVDVDGAEVKAGTGAVLRSTASPTLRAGTEPTDVMLLQGRPIGEPVAQYGPFVMNTEQEIRQAFVDYQRTQFGGWPWPADDPNHGSAEQGRFARHADGRVEDPDPRVPEG